MPQVKSAIQRLVLIFTLCAYAERARTSKAKCSKRSRPIPTAAASASAWSRPSKRLRPRMRLASARIKVFGDTYGNVVCPFDRDSSLERAFDEFFRHIDFRFKYRFAYIVHGECVVRYDNEVGKGDHRHYGAKEGSCAFSDPDALIAAFQTDIARWNRENSDA